MPTPLCFILMPFGKKKSASGQEIDFDTVYQQLIAPAVTSAGMEPLRADEEQVNGIIHKPMFERLLLCEYAVADLTTANANVFYELGVRHAAKPHTTVLLYAEGSGQLPFDVGLLRALPYRLTKDGKLAHKAKYRELLRQQLQTARQPSTDSPLYQLLDNYPDIDHTKTDVFRARVEYSKEMKQRLARARKKGLTAVRSVEKAIDNMADCEAGVVIDLFLSYRAVKGWRQMIDLVPRMSPVVANTVMVREQLALALNRAGQDTEAEGILLELIKQRGPSSETMGILGRVYKDRWERAKQANRGVLARGLLDKAITVYLKGFEADWRDAYPGINTVTLMEMKDQPDPRQQTLLPLVVYAAERKITMGLPDYWDHATLLEAAVLARDEAKANEALATTLASVRETWEPETTARNLRLIREARERRGETECQWIKEVEDELMLRAKLTESGSA